VGELKVPTQLRETARPEGGDELISFPCERVIPLEPPAIYREFLAAGPLQVKLWDDNVAWLVTRYDDVKQVLGDARVSVDRKKAGFPALSAGAAAVPERSFLRMDPPEHTRYRRILSREFTVRKMEALRPQIHGIVSNLIDGMLDQGAGVDLIKAFALPLPSMVICELLGADYADHELFEETTAAIVSHGVSAADAQAADRRMREYLTGLLEEKRRSPGEDLLSKLIHPSVPDDVIPDDDLLSVAQLLVIAGHETSASMLGLAVLTLIEHPEQRALFVGAESTSVAGAVDELLRYLTVAHLSSQRIATDDLDVGGQHVRSGEGIVALLTTANNDPAQFEDPRGLQCTRDARGHLAFGWGIHQCLGQTLARIEMQIALTDLATRLPDLSLSCERDELLVSTSGFVLSLRDLPVKWGSGARA
jgi:cytochrome P450